MEGYGRNFRAPRVDVHQFSMIPRADIPRSAFRMAHQHKTTIGGSSLYPVYLQEILPGDSFNVKMTAFCRLATPIVPLMDNLELESFFFFVPCRLVWIHWRSFMGEQLTPSDSISFSIPQVVSPVGGFAQLSLYDYFGIPCNGQTAGGNTISVNALPLRAYNLIYNEWFRDENLDNPAAVGSTSGAGYAGTNVFDDGPDPSANYVLVGTNKRHDYFTAALPWTQKGSTAITLPLGSSATVRTNPTALIGSGVTAYPLTFASNTSTTGLVSGTTGGFGAAATVGVNTGISGAATYGNPASTSVTGTVTPTNLYADLSTATAATINSIRLAFQTQKLLERDARGGTRYTEIVRSHFGVVSPDMRLQRPEYLGGGKSPVNISPVPQTTATGLTGGSTPIGTLSAVGTSVHTHGFRQSFTEHGYVIGLVVVRKDEVYQQGIRRLWSRSTRYDFYFPVFAALGEQSILNKEIFSDGSANDALTFGYQERWAEYRFHPSFTSGFFRSTNATPLDFWHLATNFTALPVLNSTFMLDNTGVTTRRVLSAGAAADKQQLLCDFFFEEMAARLMPMYSVPGLIDHF